MLIHELDDDELYGAAEATSTKIDRVTEPTKFNRVRSAVWDFGARYGLKDDPDNALRDEHGQVVFKNGKPILQKGERWPKLYGHRWKSFLGELEKDTPALIGRLSSTLSQRVVQLEQIAEQEAPAPVAKRKRRPIGFLNATFPKLAIAAVFALFFLAIPSHEEKVAPEGKFSSFASHYNIPSGRRSKVDTDLYKLAWNPPIKTLGTGGFYAVINDPPSP
jgi:hypothetical protein